MNDIYVPMLDFNVPRLIITLLLLALYYAIPVLIGIFVYHDAQRRDMKVALWTIIAILTPFLIGFLIYMVARSRHKVLKCPTCEAAITGQYVVCQKCGLKLKPACPNCGYVKKRTG